MGGSRGGNRGPDPLKNHKNIGFLSNTGPDSLKNHKATTTVQHSMLGHHRLASETPFKWCFAGRTMMARLIKLVVFEISSSSSTKKIELDQRMHLLPVCVYVVTKYMYVSCSL